MTYILADIHGHYDKYQRLLEKIGFASDDTLYVLGDVLDRGPESIRILQDMMVRPNVVPILGNHEFMVAFCLKKFILKDITDENIADLDIRAMQGYTDWVSNGGQTTLDGIYRLPREDRLDILDYIEEFSLYEEITVCGKDYLLVHAGLGGFSPDRPLEDYQLHELIFSHMDYDRVYYPDILTSKKYFRYQAACFAE